MIETYPQIIGYDPEVYEYFKEQYVLLLSNSIITQTTPRSNLCGYDINLTYPQDGIFPTLNPPYPPWGIARPSDPSAKKAAFEKVLFRDQRDRELGFVKRDAQPSEEQIRKREQWKRDMVFRPDGLNQHYLCAIWEEMVDYAFNFTYPWSECINLCLAVIWHGAR